MIHRRVALTAVLVLGGLLCGACQHERYNRKVAGAGMSINASGFLGDASVTINLGMCAGRVALTQGEATIRDACFTGDTNVVLCTDTTAASPIKCAPAPGTLTISGSGGDIISYARVR
jgi:hypothetical protein